MNEIINRLVDQTANDIPGVYGLVYESGDKGTEFTTEALEYFVELIIKECINEMQTSQRCDIFTGDLFDCEYNTAINDQIVILADHFGIK
jgi:hypothetical protein